MSAKTIRWLLLSGCLAGLLFFAGDMLFCGVWAAGRAFTPDRVFNIAAGVALWRLYLGSLLGPTGIWFELLGMLGLFLGCRQRAPRAAAIMLACLLTFDVFGISPHGKFGPVGFALRYCGSDGDAARHTMLLNSFLTAFAAIFLCVGLAIWMALTLQRKSGVPQWAVLFSPLITVWLEYLMRYVPAPLGFPLAAGWKSLCFSLFFAVVAISFRGMNKSPAEGVAR